MSKERIDEVARILDGNCFAGPNSVLRPTGFIFAASKILEQLPEFQEPKSPWVQCSERMPTEGQHDILLRYLNGGFCSVEKFYRANYGCQGCSWMEIPPYTAPESELVRRYRLKYASASNSCVMDEVCRRIKEVEKEIKDGK
jgi:hypothetical protein